MTRTLRLTQSDRRPYSSCLPVTLDLRARLPILTLMLILLGCAKLAASAAVEPPAPISVAGAPASAAPTPALAISATLENRAAVLLDLQADREATVVAVIKGRQWLAPTAAGTAELKRLAKKGSAYQLLPSSTEPGSGAGRGKLSGKLRAECAEFYLGLAGRSAARGFAVVSAGSGESVRAVPLQSTKIEPAYAAAVAGIVARIARQKVSPTIEQAYRIDLDGNGKPEVILQATHPDLNGDPAEYMPQYYSLIVVLADSPGAEPAFTGYLQGAKDMADFQVLTLDSVADLDLDGKRELLVRARHNEGWQTQVFAYDGKLKELFHSVGGEGQCPGSAK